MVLDSMKMSGLQNECDLPHGVSWQLNHLKHLLFSLFGPDAIGASEVLRWLEVLEE